MTHIEVQNILFHILKDLGIAPNTMLDKNDILFVEFQNENKDKEYRIFMGETYLSMGRIVGNTNITNNPSFTDVSIYFSKSEPTSFTALTKAVIETLYKGV